MKKSTIGPFPSSVSFSVAQKDSLKLGEKKDLTALQEKGHTKCKTSLRDFIFLLSFLHTESDALY